MIHIENITINNQFPSAESGPTSALGDALLHAMAESLFAEQAEEELGSEGEVQPPTNPPRMGSLQQQADAWNAVLHELLEIFPESFSFPGNAKDQAIAAIRAMAKAR